MNSLLDGYKENSSVPTQGGSLLDGYKEPELPPAQPEVGIVPMAKRIGQGAVQGIKNIPSALADFANQSVQAGKEEFTQGYNPIEAFTSGSLGAIQGGANLLEGIWNLPGDLKNTYYGQEKVKPTHPLTEWIPEQIAKTEYGRNYLQGVEYLQDRYPLANLLSQEIGEEIPAMLAGAGMAKYGIKAGKLAKTADKISDVGYGKLAGGSAIGGLGEGFVVDPSNGQQFDMTPEERLSGRFTNAYSGAVTAPALNIGLKAGVDVAPKVAELAPKAVDGLKQVSAKIVKSFDDIINAPTSFDQLRAINQSVSDKISPVTINQARIRNINNDLSSYANLLETQQTGEYLGTKLDETQLKAVKRHIYKLEDSFKAQNDFINGNIPNLDMDTLLQVQSNLQGRYNPTEIKDGYNVYGVPVEQNRVNSFNEKYDPYKQSQIMERIQAEQKQQLENYKQKLIEQGKIKMPIVEETPDSLLDGYDPNEVVTDINVQKNDLSQSPVMNETNDVGINNPIEVKKPIETTTPDEIKPEIENLSLKKAMVENKNGNMSEIEYVEDAPQGWSAITDALTAPQGYTWYSNGKSVVKGERKSVLVKNKISDDISGIEKTNTPDAVETSRYKYDVGDMLTKNGFTKEQREYIAKTVLDEYKGDLFNDVKIEHIYNKEKNPRIEADSYHKQFKNDDIINLFIPGTNTRFTIYKHPEAIRTLFKRLGVKLTDVVSEKYTNPKKPSFTFDPDANGNTVIRYDGTWITDGNMLIRPEDINIKTPDALKLLQEKPSDNDFSKLIPSTGKMLTDTNIVVDVPKQKSVLDSKTGFKKLVDDKKTIKVRVYENEDNKKVFIADKYAKILDDYRFYQNDTGAVIAKDANGEVKGLIMPVLTRGREVNPMPRVKQSTLDKKVYKDVAIEEPAVTNYGKHKYDKTGKSAFEVSRIKLETETQALTKAKKKQKQENAKNLKDAKSYDKVLKDGIRQWDAEIRTRQYDVAKNLTEFINNTDKIGKEWGYNGTILREIMPFLREKTEIPENLNRPDIKEVFSKLTDIQKKKLSNLADELSEKFEQYWEEYQQTHADETNEGSKDKIENYITHIWDLDRKQKSMMTNYFATRSRFAKERTIKTLFDGIQGVEMSNGEILKLQPKILDYAQILQVQADNLIKTTFDKSLADAVKKFKTYNGVELVMPASKAPSDWVTINHPALNKAIVRPLDSTVGEVITPELQNVLSEMGVAIGRRINPRASFAGVYRHKVMQPEISLRKWFSNKTLAHEIGHAIDYNLGLRKDGFATRNKSELLELNEERIKILSEHGKGAYARSDAELVAEFFGFFFNDPKLAKEIAPNATMEIIEKLSKNETLKKLLPENFDWESAKHTMEQSTTEMFKMAVKVHPDIVDTLKTVFDNTGDKTTFGKFFDNTNAFLKQAQLGFSGFHAVALSEANFANGGVSRAMRALNPIKLFNAVRNNDWDIYKKDKIAKDAIENGLQIGATLDIHRGLVESMLDDAGRWLENKIPVIGKPFSLPIKILAKGQKLNNKILWDYLHNNYKLDTYELLLNEESRKGIVSKSKKQEIAHWVNDSFGGQVWENLGVKSSQRLGEQRILLSPDWLRSTTRQALGVLSTETGHRIANKLASKSEFWEKAKKIGQEWGIHSLTDNVTASGMRGRIARRFWIRAVIQYSLYTNALNAMFREKDRKEHPELYPKKMTAKDYSTYGNSKGNETYVFLGRNSDGTERYWRLGKQFREMPELAEKPIEKLGGKASPMLQLTSQTFTSKSVGGFENKKLADKKGLERLPELAKIYGQSALPFSLNPIVNPNKDFTAFDFFAPTSRGLTFYKGRELYMDAMKKGDKQELKVISEQLKRNNLDSEEIAKSAIKEIRKEAFGNAMKKVEEIKKKRSKK